MTRPRRTALMRHSGPYAVSSRVDGTLLVKPSWPRFRPFDEAAGGGPGFPSRLSLAAELERWLNAPYDAEPRSPEPGR